MVYINDNKLNNIKLNYNNFFVVMDFDRTITSGDSLGSWSVLENPNFMNPKFKEESNTLIEKYYPLELDYSIDEETKTMYMQEWYTKNMNLFYKYNLTHDILMNCVKNSNIKFRDGFLDFFDILHRNNIPVIILSAGIGNVIEELLKLNDCYYDNVSIISNFIKFENNMMLPFTDKMIHSSNKSLDVAKFDNNLLDKDFILLFGDLIEDLSMISKSDLDRTISFGFLEANVKENLDLYKKSFDVVLTDNSSFYDVNKILSDFYNL